MTLQKRKLLVGIRRVSSGLFCLALLVFAGCNSSEKTAEPAAAVAPAQEVPAHTDAAVAKAPNLDLFKPALKDTTAEPRSEQEQAAIDLGRHLYYEKRLSSNDQIACNSCHLLDQYGVDGEAFSKGVPGTPVGAQLAYRLQRVYAHCPVLGWTRARCRGASERTHPRWQRDGHA